MRLIWLLTGGRPMAYSEEWFFDYLFWDPVDLYVDKFGRKWMAKGPWDFRRIKLRKAA